MKNCKNITGIIITVLFLFCRNTGYSQNTDCKVNMPSISGKYSGECRKGLAHGQGTSEGVDKYTGQFRKGLPHGTGTYTWSDGSSFKGQWKNGMKNGEGKMKSIDSTYTGIWKEDKYIGKEIISPYKITRSLNVTRSSFYKSEGAYDVVRIKLMRGGVENSGIVSADITNSSGEQCRDGSNYGIMQPKFPLDIRIRFTALSSFGTARFNVFFDFTINEPGTWDVRISY